MAYHISATYFNLCPVFLNCGSFMQNKRYANRHSPNWFRQILKFLVGRHNFVQALIKKNINCKSVKNVMKAQSRLQLLIALFLLVLGLTTSLAESSPMTMRVARNRWGTNRRPNKFGTGINIYSDNRGSGGYGFPIGRYRY
ncbi:hypothetical protein Fcan01_18656 [Folsomia candida]|uniref:Uncharacterized protein n=1 Tax=Folsomia candida TaxID=158441 RepID=A0A226DP94_FOLCA|nr:hypothetical protein Fcan01_18656 [Folsomia candida]